MTARPDFTQIARQVADKATGEKHKNPAAVELGRLGGLAKAAKARETAPEGRRTA